MYMDMDQMKEISSDCARSLIDVIDSSSEIILHLWYMNHSFRYFASEANMEGMCTEFFVGNDGEGIFF